MAFLRFTRDRRGYENTFLLHAAHPNERPRVLYWYRSAPGVRVGRPALDEDAIRTIEEQHPDIDFDWPHILEVGAITEPEVERRPMRQRRKSPPPAGPHAPPPLRQAEPRDRPEPAAPAVEEPSMVQAIEPEGEPMEDEEAAAAETSAEEAQDAEAKSRPHDLLEQLVGHEIATRLHARYAEIISRVHRLPLDHPERDAFQAKAEALNPDNWVTPTEVLRGVQHADATFDALRTELLAHTGHHP